MFKVYELLLNLISYKVILDVHVLSTLVKCGILHKTCSILTTNQCWFGEVDTKSPQ